MSNERSGLTRAQRESGSRPSFLGSLRSGTVARAGALALAGFLVMGAMVHDAEARRMGSSRSMGRQSTAVTQQYQAPTAPSATRAPQQAAPAATPAGATPQPARNRWLGPIAGLAAGLGIAALLSHFGLGGAFAGAMANMLMFAVIAFAVIWLIRRVTRRREDGPSAMRYASAGGAPGFDPRSSQGRDTAPRFAVPPMAAGNAAAGAAGTPGASGSFQADPAWAVPADFDRESFLHNAKVYFVRMQAAWDAADLNDIRDFTTPEMFAEIRLDLNNRGASTNRTDVVRVDADLLGIEQKPDEYLASVRFHGLIREDAGATAEEFTEVWNLLKRRQGNEGWLLAGIQQIN